MSSWWSLACREGPSTQPITPSLFYQTQSISTTKNTGNLTNQLTCLLLPKFPIAFLDLPKKHHTPAGSPGYDAEPRNTLLWSSATLSPTKTGWENDDVIRLMIQKSGVGSLSCYLQGFIHPRWCRISEPSTVSPCPLMVSWWFGDGGLDSWDAQKWKALGFLGESQTTRTQTTNLALVDMASDLERFRGGHLKSRLE